MTSAAFVAASSEVKRYLTGSEGETANGFDGPALALAGLEGRATAAGVAFLTGADGLGGDEGALKAGFAAYDESELSKYKSLM